MQILKNKSELSRWRSGLGTEALGLVPTMGYLHDGHFSLVEESRRRCGKTAVSIFVNPTQFGPKEDLASYPRDMERDLAGLAKLGVDAVYTPDPSDLYPEGFDTWVSHRGLKDQLCGAFRPGHFDGVLTVVLKLFTRFQPRAAFFGKKDFQQFTLIRRMNEDLDLGIDVVGLPTIREASGLAMSSRNTYLTPAERETAVTISKVLRGMKQAVQSGPKPAAPLVAEGRASLEAAGFRVDYVEIRRARDLAPVATADGTSVALVAAHLGRTRLIDNLEFQEV